MAETDRSQLVKIARQYYLEDLSLRQIAAKLNISITSVSRLLARARREGLVEITIQDQDPSFHDLELKIESEFSLKECSVVPFSENTESMYSDMAQAVGKLFERHLKGRTYLGVSWGETLKAIGQDMKVSGLTHVRVVPIIGAMGTIETGIYANSIAKSFAERLGGVSYLVNPPAILDSKRVKNSVLTDKNFFKVKALWNRIDVALLSVSGLESDASVARFGIFSPEELEYLRSRGVVCATNFNMIDEDGKSVANEISERIINMDLLQLRKARIVILAACGLKKTRAIAAALLGRIPDILVTDNKTAAHLLK
jgi:deoxyribonucleoside regulator